MKNRRTLLTTIGGLVAAGALWADFIDQEPAAVVPVAASPTGIRPNDIITAPTVTSADELNRLFSRSAAIVHLDVDWSATAAISRPAILKLREDLESDEFLKHVGFRRVDCTEQNGEVWDRLGDLLTNEQSIHMVSGNGALLFIKYGKVVDSVGYAGYEGAERLIERARQIYR